MNIFKKVINNPIDTILFLLTRLGVRNLIPDKSYIRLLWWLHYGKRINLDNPQTFTEKIQWLKLNDRNLDYTNMVDKFAVKEIVKKIIGAQYIIPTLGVWDNPEDIDWRNLPNKFVLKTTHGGGGQGIIICRDKASFDKASAIKKLKKAKKQNAYLKLGEWPYKNIKKRIIAEKFIEVPDKADLTDYKFFCFNGEPRFLKVDFDRFIDHHANYYDIDWNLLPFGEADLPPVESHIEQCPPNFDKMIAIARKLSNGHTFLRVDLYNIAGRIFFSELTFYPASGLNKFTTSNADKEIGKYLTLPCRYELFINEK